eukprot:scaffold45395_cov60-Phaeocystis_antarctica.AAC.2
MPLAPPPPHAIPTSPPTPRPASYAPLSTRQSATAFNQPLSFDTSKVTNMYRMFTVRSARALAPSLESGPPRACRLRRRRPTPSLPAHISPRIACPPFDSAARVCVQPAAELGHVQRHRHDPHVRGALRACPGPQPSVVRTSPVCMPLAPSSPHALLPRRAASLAPHRMPSFRLGSKRRRSTSR